MNNTYATFKKNQILAISRKQNFNGSLLRKPLSKKVRVTSKILPHFAVFIYSKFCNSYSVRNKNDDVIFFTAYFLANMCEFFTYYRVNCMQNGQFTMQTKSRQMTFNSPVF